MYRTIETSMWTDEHGVPRRVPSHKRRMNFGRCVLHAQLRGFIFRRDDFTCRHCGRRALGSKDYTGRFAPTSTDGVLMVLDHVLGLVNGGTNHPENLQVLCDPCNARKVTTHDICGRAG
jgi:5-methylcytosine-specific restriction endonuclease McrA